MVAMPTTFWKPEEIPTSGFECRLEPIGHPQIVVNMLLSISGMRPAFTTMIDQGFLTCQWRQVFLNMREEPELGPGGVFSIVVDGRDRVGMMDFYLLYLQAHELLGVILLEEEEFVTPKEFKRRTKQGR